jgi:hypothetical protein
MAIAIGVKFIVQRFVIIEKRKSIRLSCVRKMRKKELSKSSFFANETNSPLKMAPMKTNGHMFK